MTEKAYNKNAADPEQVEGARKKELWDKKREKDDMRELMQIPAFRRFLWRIITFCSVFDDIWHPSAVIHRSAGQQRVGQVLLGMAKGADQDKFFLMWKENDQNEELDNDNRS
jgi:hypothetical protein